MVGCATATIWDKRKSCFARDFGSAIRLFAFGFPRKRCSGIRESRGHGVIVHAMFGSKHQSAAFHIGRSGCGIDSSAPMEKQVEVVERAERLTGGAFYAQRGPCNN